MEEATALEGHIASPDVHVDENKHLIRMYFHGSHAGTEQKTVSAVSGDGISFEVSEPIVGSSYFRVFEYKGVYYAMDTHGFLNRSDYPDKSWVTADKELIPPITVEDAFGRRDDIRIRHSAVLVRGDTLYLFYSRTSDAPERIVMTQVPLKGDWKQWRAGEPVEVIRPELKYEGIFYPNKPSGKGGAIEVQQLRDPYVFEAAGKLYLFYSIAGEMGIAVADLAIE